MFMPRISKALFLLIATLTSIGLIASSFDALAQDKDKKKEEQKDKNGKDKKETVKDKKDDKDKKEAVKDKKEAVKDKKDDKDKKEEKKEPFKADKAQLEFKHIEKEKTFWVFAVAFGGDGKTVAAAYRDNSVKIWDLGAKKDLQTLKGNPTENKAIVVVKGDIYVSTGAWDKKKKAWEGEIKIWDGKSPKSAKSIRGHAAPIEFMDISKDGKFLATASDDNTVLIWSLADGKTTQTVKGHTDGVNSVSFSPDGKQVVTTSKDKTVRVWDIDGAKEVANYKVEREVEEKDAKGKVTKKKELGREFTRALFIDGGKKIVACNLDGVIKVYDVADKKELHEVKAHEGIWALALSPDGTKLASGGYDGTIKVWSTADGKALKTIKAHLHPSIPTEGGTVIALAFSPDGQRIASGGIDGVVKIWSVK
jgi:WD40 repeat protein